MVRVLHVFFINMKSINRQIDTGGATKINFIIIVFRYEKFQKNATSKNDFRSRSGALHQNLLALLALSEILILTIDQNTFVEHQNHSFITRRTSGTRVDTCKVIVVSYLPTDRPTSRKKVLWFWWNFARRLVMVTYCFCICGFPRKKSLLGLRSIDPPARGDVRQDIPPLLINIEV